MSRFLIGIAASVVAVIGFVAVFRDRLPYSFGDLRDRQAAILYSALKRWQMEGGDLKEFVGTGNHLKVDLIRTNFVSSGKAYTTEVIYSHYFLNHRGVLAGTTNAQVFWLGKDGNITLLRGDEKLEGTTNRDH